MTFEEWYSKEYPSVFHLGGLRRKDSGEYTQEETRIVAEAYMAGEKARQELDASTAEFEHLMGNDGKEIAKAIRNTPISEQ